MKRIFTLVAFLGMFVGGMFAQTSSFVTLSHEGQLSFFEGYEALENALEAAQDDDVLYLSRGMYAISTQELKITKKVRLVGDGYDTFVNSRVSYDTGGATWIYTEAEPALEGVRVKSVNNAVQQSGFTDMLVIRSCKIDELGLRSDSERYFLERCYVGTMNIVASEANNQSVYVRNSKVEYFFCKGFGGKVVFENCNIRELLEFAGTAYSCIIATISFSNREGYAYKCWLPGFEGTEESGLSQADSCYYYINCTMDDNLETNWYTDILGSDGTRAGIHGGQFPYSESPALPTVDVANSSVSYDSSNNQLNVAITVKE
ncbi:MAG: hypothetical protein K2M27_01150 [Muribaculaceae bacterium]|nr:hypothetical protein [Muribaculaceae bacterium]